MFNDFLILLRNWKTSLVAVAPLITGLLITFGLIDLEQQSAIVDGVEVVFDAANAITNEVAQLVLYAQGLIGLFSKDGNLRSEDVGLNS